MCEAPCSIQTARYGAQRSEQSPNRSISCSARCSAGQAHPRTSRCNAHLLIVPPNSAGSPPDQGRGVSFRLPPQMAWCRPCEQAKAVVGNNRDTHYAPQAARQPQNWLSKEKERDSSQISTDIHSRTGRLCECKSERTTQENAFPWEAAEDTAGEGIYVEA